ncbi:GGDEF domain-containing protein [Falsihalocynthiibacter sp. SS001]|uniref:GGDEF domain-containing protein n=1 Tax=Falsihalocynthiibacter sp. SS001 TaxID=3349698 RepID=UPI0036D38E9C
MNADAVHLETTLQAHAGAAILINDSGDIVAANASAKALDLGVGASFAAQCQDPEAAQHQISDIAPATGLRLLSLRLAGNEDMALIVSRVNSQTEEGLTLVRCELPRDFVETFNKMALELEQLNHSVDAERQKRRALEIANANLTEEVQRDFKTSLLTQEGLNLALQERANAAPNMPVAMIYLDINNFKQINDQYGHGAGDKAIAAVGQIIRDNLRKTDLAARLGGDEFAIVLNDAKTSDQIDGFVKRLNVSMENPITYDEPTTGRTHQLYLSFSAGVAVYPSDTTDITLLSSFADRAMYAAKANGQLISIYGQDD